MGAQPADIEREIEEQRERAGERMSKLRERLWSDAGEARTRMRGRASQASHMARRGATTGLAAGTLMIIGVFAFGYWIGGMISARSERRRYRWWE